MCLFWFIFHCIYLFGAMAVQYFSSKHILDCHHSIIGTSYRTNCPLVLGVWHQNVCSSLCLFPVCSPRSLEDTGMFIRYSFVRQPELRDETTASRYRKKTSPIPSVNNGGFAESTNNSNRQEGTLTTGELTVPAILPQPSVETASENITREVHAD